MSDLSEIENELRKLRPVQPSPILLERVAEAIGGPDPQAAFAGRSSAAARVFRNWLSLGAGLAAAAILLLLTVMKMGDGKRFVKEVSSISPGRETERASAARSETESMAESTLRSRFLPAGATRVKVCSLSPVLLSRCGACATRRGRRCNGAIRQPVLQSASLIPVRRYCYYRFQVNEHDAEALLKKSANHHHHEIQT